LTRYRPAAGLLLDTLFFRHDLFSKSENSIFADHARRADIRVHA
jgi:hypothetical protein